MKRAAMLLGTLLFAACDWDQVSLLDAMPAEGPTAHRRVEVYLAVDGVSRVALDAAMARGGFGGFQVATLPMYPATSDASWSRMLKAPRVAGYEYTYFDPERDEVMNPDLEGLAGHALPPGQHDDDFPYYRAFDMHGESYADALVSYADPAAAFATRLDSLFVTLGGRLGTADVFTAYILELDVVAHGEGFEPMVRMLEVLSSRMVQFQHAHREVDVRFTLMSDHGSDHVPKSETVAAGELLQLVGVQAVSRIADGAGLAQPWAVAEEHSRTTYGVAHTTPEWTETVALRISRDAAVDLVVARADTPEVSFAATEWTALFLNGARVARFGLDEVTQTLWLERAGAWASLGIALPPGDEAWVSMSDAVLFEQTAQGQYPDLVFRARTALLPLSVRFPAQVVYSLRDHAVMRGFRVPGSDSLGASGSHGAMGGGGSRGVLLTASRELPQTVRSDDLLTLFAPLRRHVEARFAGAR